jgi:hypothetical protein
VSDLEVRLVELGGALDHPEGEQLLAHVRAELDGRAATPTDGRRGRVVGRVLVGAAAAMLVLAVSLPASRTAIADFFRVDGVELRDARDRPRAAPSSTTLPPLDSVAAARRRVGFTVRTAPGLGTPTVTVDPEVPGGLVTLDYPGYRVVEFAAPTDGAVMAKFMDPRTHVDATEVRANPGYWITGTHHEIAYLDRDNKVRTATMHTAGHVLLWSEAGVTIRVEGPETLAQAQAIAASLT